MTSPRFYDSIDHQGVMDVTIDLSDFNAEKLKHMELMGKESLWGLDFWTSSRKDW